MMESECFLSTKYAACVTEEIAGEFTVDEGHVFSQEQGAEWCVFCERWDCGDDAANCPC